jgi:predicted alpha-1,6-mannanase (GH76 family)
VRDIWSGRADEAERAVLGRHVRRLWALPGTALGVVSHPATPSSRLFARWDYWWQAHLLDCAVDAFDRSPSRERRALVAAVVRGHHVRNAGRWGNDYFDDMAWLGLALQRAGEVVGVRHPAAVAELTRTLHGAWSDEHGGGVPWRRGDDFRNVPANGPAAILLARTGDVARAQATAGWIDAGLLDPATGLVLDGLRPGGVLETAVYTYNQGVVLGAETELAVRTDAPVHAERVHRLVAAVAERLATDDVLHTHRGGDGGLFSGILARYLALVARALPGTGEADVQARTTATRLVLRSARSVWAHRAQTPDGAVFGHDWAAPARVPRPGGDEPERDLSVQLGAWMLLEAAARVCDEPV